MLIGLFLAVVTASKVVGDELASRTALTLFAKPMSRWGFLFGKAMGAFSTAAIVVAILGIHITAVWYFGYYGFTHMSQANQLPTDQYSTSYRWAGLLPRMRWS